MAKIAQALITCALIVAACWCLAAGHELAALFFGIGVLLCLP